MGAFQNIGVSDYLKRYGWKYGIQRGAFTAFPFHVVNDYENKKILYYSKIEKKLKKRYLKAALIDPDGLSFGKVKVDNPIWVYWKQGLDQAPEIVKSCINSIKQNADTKVIIITDDNVEQYVKFPSYIIEKLEKGTMSTAAYVDIAKQIIDQRVYKILADNPDLFSADDAEHKRSKAFLLLGVASYLDIDIAEAIRH